MKKLKTLAAPRYIIHWMMLLVLFTVSFNSIEHYYMKQSAFYGTPIDAHTFNNLCFFDASYVLAAKEGGYDHYRYFASFFLLDLVFPIVYSAFLWSCIQLMEKPRWLLRVAGIIICLGAAFDYGENILFAIFLKAKSNDLAYSVAFCTTIKSCLLALNSLIAIIALVQRCYLIFANKKQITKDRIQTALIVIGTASAPLIIFYSLGQSSVDDKIKVLTVSAAAYFLVYKLMTGWLFINMNLRLAAQRQSLDTLQDHLGISITLLKGKIDSFWLHDIQFTISEVDDKGQSKGKSYLVTPLGIAKQMPASTHSKSYGPASANSDYIMSPEEETTFSGYTVVNKGAVIAIKALVVGTRPFYGLESRTQKPITWQTSIIVLPVPERLS